MQHTLAKSAQIDGIGLHSGERVTLTLHPAGQGHGIVFRRKDLPSKPVIPAHARVSRPTPLCTTLSADDGAASVRTTEHLLSALVCAGVDNALIDVDGPEIPLRDGSAREFFNLIRDAGLSRQGGDRMAIMMRDPVEVRDGDKWARLVPDTRRRFQMTIDFPHPLIGQQTARFDLDEDDYETEIAPARTFGFLRDFEALRDAGLIKGGSLTSAIVFDEAGIVNPEGLRFADEPARHKLLDAIGDMALAGMPVIGRYEGYKASHALNTQLVQTLLRTQDAWTECRMPKDQNRAASARKAPLATPHEVG